jgi:hypothetical protein
MAWELWDLIILIIENSIKSKIKKFEGNFNFTQMYILYINLQNYVVICAWQQVFH